MIAEYNRRQSLKTLGHLLLAPFGFMAAWYFFKWGVPWIVSLFEEHPPAWLGRAGASVFLVLLTASAWKRHVAEKEALDLESGLFWKGEQETGGGYHTQHHINQVAGTAWLLVGIFMSGPLSFFRAISASAMRLPNDPELERRMESLLEDLRSRKKWVEASLFSQQWDDMTSLIRVGAVEFSSIKGRVKAAN